MQQFIVAPNEAERLEALQRYAILDTQAEVAFDRIAALAARLLEAPVALVSMMDEKRQWFKACYGVSVEETPREIAFCTYTILQDEVFVIPDMTQDERFANNPFVTGWPGVRFYAGAPLKSPEGYNVGSLCILDMEPRAGLDEKQKATLVDLAAIVVDELEWHLAGLALQQAHEEVQAANQELEGRVEERTDALRRANEHLMHELMEHERTEQALRKSERDYRNLFDYAHDAILILSPETEVVLDANQRACELYGFDYDEFIGMSLEVFTKEVPRGKQLLEETLELGEAFQLETVQYRRDGTEIWLEVNASVIEYHGQRAVLSVNRDISARKQTEATLRRQAMVFEKLSESVVLTDENGLVLDCNPATEAIYGYAKEELLGHQMTHWLIPKEADGLVEEIAKGVYYGDGWSGNVPFVAKDGREGVSDLRVIPIKDGEGELVGTMGVAEDITERLRMEARLLHDATYDALTDLPNRMLFLDHLRRALAQAQRQADRQIAVLFLDLDRFKLINDSLGHSVGDQLLMGVARRLETWLRANDVIARLGGDEFVILLTDIQGATEAIQVAERIQEELAQPFYLGTYQVFTASSVGIALGQGGEAPETLLRDADSAMSRAKSLGKGRYQLFDESMAAHATSRLQMETELRFALERQEFELHYQPLVLLASGAVAGFESLVRWRHPQRGMISPAEFIPIAEETGLIIPLGRWVMSEACRQLKVWQERYPSRSLFMSVNVSAKQFQHGELVKDVAELISTCGVEPHQLKLEITESTVMERGTEALALLEALKALGVRLAIDDFGTGYSSLAYLTRFAVDTLKIDRSFVDKLGQNSEDEAIVGAIVTLAKNLGLDVTAEGVETAEQAAFLRALKCERGQGFYFSRPLPAVEAEHYLVNAGKGRVTLPL